MALSGRPRSTHPVVLVLATVVTAVAVYGLWQVGYVMSLVFGWAPATNAPALVASAIAVAGTLMGLVVAFVLASSRTRRDRSTRNPEN